MPAKLHMCPRRVTQEEEDWRGHFPGKAEMHLKAPSNSRFSMLACSNMLAVAKNLQKHLKYKVYTHYFRYLNQNLSKSL